MRSERPFYFFVPAKRPCGVGQYAERLAKSLPEVTPRPAKLWHMLYAPMAYSSGPKGIHIQHEYSLLGPLGLGWLMLWAWYWFAICALPNTPLFVTVHTVPDWSQRSWPVRLYGRLHDSLMCQVATRLIFLSQDSLLRFGHPSAAKLVIPLGAYV